MAKEKALKVQYYIIELEDKFSMGELKIIFCFNIIACIYFAISSRAIIL